MTDEAVLVVDDDASILGVVESILEFEGIAVRTATNGREALACLESGPCSLILLDMRMPIMDGWQFARELRQRGLQTPILVMTAARDASEWAEEIGATGVIPKPFDFDELVTAVTAARKA